jgi:hypothetical protein
VIKRFCYGGGSSARMTQRGFVSFVLLVAADSDTCGRLGHFHCGSSALKMTTPQHKADVTDKSLPRQ